METSRLMAAPFPVDALPYTREALLAIPMRDQGIIAIRLVWAGLAGAVLGAERTRRRGRATVGPRTISLVSIGAALFTVAGCFGPGGDPTRLAAAAASGVGFIGAGVISGGSDGPIDGLTTAASIWCAAALGVASGVGLGFTVTIGTAIAVAVLESSHVYARLRRRRLRQQKRENDNPLA